MVLIDGHWTGRKAELVCLWEPWRVRLKPQCDEINLWLKSIKSQRQKEQAEKTSAPIGAWKWNLLRLFMEIRTDRHTVRPTDRPSNGRTDSRAHREVSLLMKINTRSFKRKNVNMVNILLLPVLFWFATYPWNRRWKDCFFCTFHTRKSSLLGRGK